MKEAYKKPEVEIVEIDAADIIFESGGGGGGGCGGGSQVAEC